MRRVIRDLGPKLIHTGVAALRAHRVHPLPVCRVPTQRVCKHRAVEACEVAGRVSAGRVSTFETLVTALPRDVQQRGAELHHRDVAVRKPTRTPVQETSQTRWQCRPMSRIRMRVPCTRRLPRSHQASTHEVSEQSAASIERNPESGIGVQAGSPSPIRAPHVAPHTAVTTGPYTASVQYAAKSAHDQVAPWMS